MSLVYKICSKNEWNKAIIENFGSFKTINKSERIGRNPKNKKTYKISARKSLIFTPSTFLKKKFRNL